MTTKRFLCIHDLEFEFLFLKSVCLFLSFFVYEFFLNFSTYLINLLKCKLQYIFAEHIWIAIWSYRIYGKVLVLRNCGFIITDFKICVKTFSYYTQY